MAEQVYSERQKEILDTALLLAAAGGIPNVTIKQLAAALGVTEPAIYRHFTSKSAIIRAMIGNFKTAADNALITGGRGGLAGIEAFVKSRFALAESNPALAKVMFAEELFMDDPEYAGLIMDMMHSHRDLLRGMFEAARRNGELRSDIAPDTLFRIVMGPVRLLVKQWGMSNRAFDLRAAGDELWDSLVKVLS